MSKTKKMCRAILLLAACAGFGFAGAATGMGPLLDAASPADQANPSARTIDRILPLTYESIQNLPVNFEPKKLKRGFNPKAEPGILQPDQYGSIRIEMREVERIEVELGKGQSYRGYLIAGESLRPLPIGSTLDPLKGIFFWMPGPGFLGSYDFIFTRTDEFGVTKRIPVKVTIKPKYEKR